MAPMAIENNYEVGRKASDDRTPKVQEKADNLSPFQVAKFSYMFEAFFDLDKNGVIEYDDLIAFGERIVQYTGWQKDTSATGRKDGKFYGMQDVLRTFHECIKDQVKLEYLDEEVSDADCLISWDEAGKRYNEVYYNKHITMNMRQWLNMWGRLCYGAAGISDFPIWVQLLPDLFFQIVDRDGDGMISKEELQHFYEHVTGLHPSIIEKTTNEGYRALTANGDYELDRQNYMFCFANFLLGKGIYGPGKYLFGTFDNREIEEQYKVIYTDEADKDMDY